MYFFILTPLNIQLHKIIYICFRLRCYFAKAQCVDSTLHNAGEGSCASLGLKATKATTAKITTTQPTTITTHPVTTAQPTTDPLRVICDSISHVHCANDIEPVCGSDDRTYVNTCEFHIEVCQRRDLTIKHIGFC
ncbi:uncharacterized protein LOC128553486 [Mercenaria mercenaria]|uniref:uncharacterized protein LOC128553486 n=1 Tax=Mercenaria mercenaria TaxID=6596 RepID=UPI00234ED95E|nr:uncharacterized protein LOC128553486 [Mercenaria mercenaria]